jgi:hypothetical protein
MLFYILHKNNTQKPNILKTYFKNRGEGGKAILVDSWTGPEGSRKFRLPDFWTGP